MRGVWEVQTSVAPPPGDGTVSGVAPGEWHAVVREVLEQAPPPPADPKGAATRGRAGRARLFAVLTLILIAVAAWNLTDLRLDRRPAFTGAQVSEGALATIFLTAMGLEQYRARTGAYPENLEVAGLEFPDLTYHLEGDRYVLTSGATSPSASYTSGDDLSPYELALDHVLRSSRGGS